MGLRILKKIPILRDIVYASDALRSRRVVEWVKPYLTKKDIILDIGAGSCTTCHALRKEGYKVAPLDSQNLSFVKDIDPILSDGSRIPFHDGSFTASLLITVLITRRTR